jgi:nitric oxide dioxygenase
MTPQDIEIVQSSFAEIAPVDDETGLQFYQRLFRIAPELKPLFPGDMEEQGRMFMSMLTVAVNGLSNLDRIEADLADLAIRHVGYGVKPDHYAKVGAALLWTLEENLADTFTDDVRRAWVAVYDTLSGVMIRAAYGKSGAPPRGLL